jgi:MFS family permease
VIAPLVGGSLGDRMDRRRLILITEGAHVLCTLVFAILVATDHVTVGLVAGFGFLAGLFWSAGLPVRQAMVSDLVDTPAVTNAVVLFSGIFNCMLVLAPGLSGFIIDAVGPEGSFFTGLGLTLASLSLWLLVPKSPERQVRKRESPVRAMAEGVRYVRTEPLVLMVIVGLGAYTMLSQSYYSILPVFQRDVLQVSASGLGLMATMVGIGSVIASVLLVMVPAKQYTPARMVMVGICHGLVLIGFAQSSNYPLSLGILVVMGVCQASFLTMNTAMIQETTPREVAGRVMALRTVPWGFQPVGQVVLGSAAEAAGPQRGLAFIGVAATALQAGVLLWMRSIGRRRAAAAGGKTP